jgi:acetyl-CoA decarbonylase/synthase complex subunit gamma
VRHTGIHIIGDAPWGTHFCQFYQTKQDLIDVLVPYFKAGLENNEFCMWVTSEPLRAQEARNALVQEVPRLADYISKGQIEILDYSQWYTAGGGFESDRVLQGWVGKLEAALQAVEGQRPLIHAATPENADALAALAVKYKAPLAAKADSLDALAELTKKLAAAGVQDIVLDLSTDNPAATMQMNTIARKAALKSTFEPMGYPVMNILGGQDLPSLVADASTLICKYAAILVVDTLAYQALLPMMMLRQNIYTDPQKPIQVEPKVYPIGDADENSPVLVTTNFSLTYFIVSGEIENSGVPSHLVIVECEGMSVLTAWAAGKFSGEKIGAFIKQSGLEQQVKTRRLIIPGYVAQISGELEESLPGWEIVVGPQEASDLGSFMKLQTAVA